MKRKAYKRHRRRVQRYLDPWLTMLGLKWWHIEVRYYDKEKKFRETDGSGLLVVMRAWALWEYMDLTIAVNLPAVARMDDDELERTVVHELCHALVNELREPDPDIKHEERVVTALTKAFMWVRDITRDESGTIKQRRKP